MCIRDRVAKAPILALPNFSTPKFSIDAILIILPVILVITSEHIGHQIVTSKIVGRDLLKDPGLHRSLFGDNFSTMISGLIGSVPTTTYGENIGVMAVTRVYLSLIHILEDGEHTLKLEVTNNDNKAIGVEGAYVINNGGLGMVGIEKAEYTMKEDSEMKMKLVRVGGSKGEATVTVAPNPCLLYTSRCV